MNRRQSRRWFKALSRRYVEGVELLRRCDPGSDLERRMAANLFRMDQILAEADDQLRQTGRIDVRNLVTAKEFPAQ